MYYLPTSCLFFFFIFSLFHPLPCSSSKKELGWCEAKFQCGNITAGFPFWGGNRPDHCGHPWLKLHCNKNNIISLFISKEEFSVFHLYQNNTLTLARAELLSSFCSSLALESFLHPALFELSPTYKILSVFYHCNYPTHNHSSYKCPEIGPIIASENLKYHETCRKRFDVNVPTSFVPEEKELNITNLESVLRKGFDVKVKIDMKPCQECSSSHGICSFDETWPYEFKCIPPHPPTDRGLSAGGKTGHSVKAKIGIMIACGFLVATLIAGGLLCVISRRRKTSDDLRRQNLKALIPLKHYTYAQVKKITKSFAELVGKGRFGTVYRGTLADGRSVAVKVLKESKGNGEDFINEVASVSKTSHVNIVNLLGFCSEGSKRAIIYEFLENGSLDKFISNKTSKDIDWTTLYSIALGVARGLEYLHHGCKTSIVHFDIKPQNVLLDNNLCPKVSDFGLAKLCEKKENILSLLDTRGTIGYIAPELFSRMYGRVSHKSDVYSYGMLLFEMIGARNKPSTEGSASNPSSMYFPEWIYKDLENRDNGRLIENGINNEEEEIARKMTLVGLWCIQPSPSDRPSMDRVVEMMEGNVNALEVPPRPVFKIPAAPLQESSTISEDISAYTEVCSINVA